MEQSNLLARCWWLLQSRAPESALLAALCLSSINNKFNVRAWFWQAASYLWHTRATPIQILITAGCWATTLQTFNGLPISLSARLRIALWRSTGRMRVKAAFGWEAEQ